MFSFVVFQIGEMDAEPGPSTSAQVEEMDEGDEVEEEGSGESENEESESEFSDSEGEEEPPQREEIVDSESPEGIADELVSQAPLKFLNG